MSNAAKLKKRAVELEQKKQFDKALALYIQFLKESGSALDDIDIPLYNRVGDLLLRIGNASDALNYYEQAVDLYAERGFHNNAIALCNKVLRQSPGRASIYYKLGKISATKGFKSDAKKNFLEYADRMQKAGQIDEAFRALKEFADLCPDQDDIRLMLAEQLTKEKRQDEALEQLHKLHDKLDSEGRTAEARATADRMKSIDPEAVPKTTGSNRQVKSTDLIFLDTSYEQATTRAREVVPTPMPPSTRHVSDPDLVVLTMGDQPDAGVAPVERSPIADDFALDLSTPNEDASTASLSLLDVGEDIPPADDLIAALESADAHPPAARQSHITPLDIELDVPVAPAAPVMDVITVDILPPEGLQVERDVVAAQPVIDETPAYVAGPPLSVDYASDLASDLVAPEDADGGDLFDFRGPPKSDEDVVEVAPVLNLDPDVAFPSFDLGDTALPSADEVTSGASLAAALGTDPYGADPFAADPTLASDPAFGAGATLGADAAVRDLGSDLGVVGTPPAHELLTPGAGSAEELGTDLELEWTAMGDSATPVLDAADGAMSLDDLTVADALETIEPVNPRRATPRAVPTPVAALDLGESGTTELEVPIDDLLQQTPVESESVAHVETPRRLTSDVDEIPPAATEVVLEVITPAAYGPPPAPPLTSEPEASRLAGWEVQRTRAERLLESGDRMGGVLLLEEVAAELERIGDLERSLTIIDELIRLSPDSIRHHQKRVELAFRASDRAKLTDAYLELGDALFRSGEERKARAVYQRVLELAPDDPRARAAVESVASMSPPAGSGAIQAIVTPQPMADARPTPPATPRPASATPRAPAANGTRSPNGISAPPQSRKPSPLDRSVASNGDFVDLGEWLRSGENPKSTRMVAEEKPPTGDEQADFQEMLKRFKQGVAENVDEEDYESHYDLGVAYKEMGLMDEAVAEFQKALRGSSNRVRSYEALGQCFVEKEQYQVAASVLSRAIALGEGDDHHLVGVLYLLGRATEALSKNGDALDYYQRVFAVDIEFRDVADRISAIERKAT